ncbi:L,D-transpeptidase family protein [Novosphingobium sp. KCTC 2891]|uniref:L,D-transpeptidase family protein n=1 Tax=Novosphingobium sp. KCTC 2891 TaxID=2989730 RepID=UPI0022213BF6|nr:L,D-transpeptidase family protein [Novosphingobium sp. KCTC 2891]MCW1382166.1 L,D-transpeptidase family protein [Novosphingobium sp. KCTC 2891]
MIRSHGGRSIRRLTLSLCAAASVLVMAPGAAHAQVAPADLAGELEDGGGDAAQLRDFYASRGYRPLWITGGTVSPAASALLDLIRTSKFDGIKPKKAREGDLRKALERADDPTPENLLRAEIAASRALAAYVQQMRKAPRADMIYESPALAPGVPTTAAVLGMAAAAPSIDAFVRTMGWMHPWYAPLRQALAQDGLDDSSRQLLAANLERVRAIPAFQKGRYVLVDAAGARLTMMQDGQPVGTMRVVVGKPEMPTPMMAGFLRYAQLNPYWNIPPDLVKARIAPNVLGKGLRYLKAKGYQVLSGWDEDARVIDPARVDWQAIAAGAEDLRVRQLPGGDNFMGKVKFMFPNAQGIYLHDTPEKGLMKEDERQFSSGCVRLEDAPRLGRWLMGKPLPRAGKAVEQRVDLPVPVPVYITYLTAAPDANGQIAFRADPYNRDGLAPGAPRMASARR